MRIFTLSILVLSLGFSSYSQAAAYKWVDENGNIVYSQQPPSENEKQYQRLKGLPKSPGSSVTPDSPSTSVTNNSTQQKSKNNTGISKETAAKVNETRQKNCASAKRNLELYTTYRRFPDKDGNMTRMDDNERQKNIQEAEQQIQDFCD